MSVARVRLEGELDVSCARDARTAIDAAMSAPGVALLELDLADVTFIDSTGIGVLIGAMQRAKAADQEVEIVAVSATVRRVLDMTGVELRFA